MRSHHKNSGTGKSPEENNTFDFAVDSLHNSGMDIRKSKRDIVLSIRINPALLAEFVKHNMMMPKAEKQVSARKRSDVRRLTPEIQWSPPSSSGISLTKREADIMHSLSTGMLNKEIAFELGLSINTVKNHLKSIYNKLSVENRSEAIVRYMNYSDKESFPENDRKERM